MIHEFQVTVRYAETDMMGIVHHSVYPVWAEAARTAMMKSMGISYSEVEASGIMLPVTELYLRYKSPTFFEDEIIIYSAVTQLDNRRVRIDYKLVRENEVICTIGYSKHIFMGSESRKPVRISQEILDRFMMYYNPEFQQG